MADLKTKNSFEDPKEFLELLEPQKKREDSFKLLEILSEVTGDRPTMWGETMIGFGVMNYTNTSGSHQWMATGFSPRKQNLTVYIMDGFKQYQSILDKLGKFTLGKSCLYIKKLEDVNIDVLKDLIRTSSENVKNGGKIEY